MAYKMKPNKSVQKRFKFSKTGKVKRHQAYHSHLMSSRTGTKCRRSRRPLVLSETLGGNLRRMVNLSGRNPNRTRHERQLLIAGRAKAAQAAAPTQAATQA
jgi:large subunit ribosomal protein L35